MSPRHFLEVDDLTPGELDAVLATAAEPAAARLLVHRSVGLYFEKPSLRTRHSCEVAVVQLGGHPLTFRQEEVGAGAREPIGDVARVLSGYHAAARRPGLRPRPAGGAGGGRHGARSSTCSPTGPTPARPWPTC